MQREGQSYDKEWDEFWEVFQHENDGEFDAANKGETPKRLVLEGDFKKEL